MTRIKQVENSMEVMEEQVYAYKKYADIVEWLYSRDKVYNSVQDWRDALIEKLKEVLLEDLE